MKTVTVPCRSKGNWEVECAKLNEMERINLIGCLENAKLDLMRATRKDARLLILYTTTCETLNKLRQAWMLDEQ